MFTIIKGDHSVHFRYVGTTFWSSPEMLDSANSTFTKESDIFPLALIFVITMSRGRHAFDDYNPRNMEETTEQKNDRIKKRHDRMYKEKQSMV
jgi:serine/threonine protein kinase